MTSSLNKLLLDLANMWRVAVGKPEVNYHAILGTFPETCDLCRDGTSADALTYGTDKHGVISMQCAQCGRIAPASIPLDEFLKVSDFESINAEWLSSNSIPEHIKMIHKQRLVDEANPQPPRFGGITTTESITSGERRPDPILKPRKRMPRTQETRPEERAERPGPSIPKHRKIIESEAPDNP